MVLKLSALVLLIFCGVLTDSAFSGIPVPAQEISVGAEATIERRPGRFSQTAYELAGYSVAQAKSYVNNISREEEQEVIARLLYRMELWGRNLDDSTIDMTTAQAVAASRGYLTRYQMAGSTERAEYLSRIKLYLSVRHLTAEEQLDELYRYLGYESAADYHAYRESLHPSAEEVAAGKAAEAEYYREERRKAGFTDGETQEP
jgi:AraC-like DNA-binding protein